MRNPRLGTKVIFSLLCVDALALATSFLLERLLWALDGRHPEADLRSWGALSGLTLAADLLVGLAATLPARRTLKHVLRSPAEGEWTGLLNLASLPLHICLGHTLVSFASCTASFAFFRGAASALSGGAAIVRPLSALTVLTMAALPLYLLLRVRVRAALQLVPTENSKSALFLVERMPALASRTRRRLLAALTLPTAFVAMPLVLLVHFNSFLSHERAQRSAAILKEIGPTPFEQITPGALSSGNAIWVCALLGATAITVAALLGATWGKRFSQDIALVTRELRGTGVADVLRGTRILRQAEFRVVRELMQAVDELGAVFRRFASGQEKAIDAREATARMRSLFLASMSHDLRAPLNAILGFAELALRHDLNPAQLESLSIIEQRGRELLALIQTILDSARAEVGELLVTPEWVTVGDVVMAAVSEAQDLFISEDVTLAGEVQPGLPKLYADSVRLVQGIAAIVLCCTRLLRRGEIRVRATLPSASERLFFYVEASGRGMHAEDRARVFDALADSEKAREYGSLGLGLLLARAIFVAHGGGIFAESSKDGGVLFSAYVPTDENDVLDATSKGRLSVRQLNAASVH